MSKWKISAIQRAINSLEGGVLWQNRKTLAEDVTKEYANILTDRDALQELVDRQANDEGLWFAAQTAPEEYLQAALRTLHARIENK